MPRSLKPLHEQVIVITGASSGIGLCTAETAARQGAKLVLSSRSEEIMGRLVDGMNTNGIVAIHVTADVADRDQVQAIADAAIAQFGGIDTWINNAGVSIFGRLDQVSEADSRRLFDTNFWGLVNGSLVALPHLKKRGGALINIGSEVSEAVIPLQSMYSASKHAVKGFTDGLRIEIEELDKAPVSITLVQPTATDTPFPENARNYMAHEPQLPTPQSDPQDVADAILQAAVTPTHHVKIGMAKLNTAMANLVPVLADKMAAAQANRQQLNESPVNPEGTLNRPGHRGRVYGINHPSNA